MLLIMLGYKNMIWKYTIDECDLPLIFLAAESKYHIHFYPPHLDFSVLYLAIFIYQEKLQQTISRKLSIK